MVEYPSLQPLCDVMDFGRIGLFTGDDSGGSRTDRQRQHRQDERRHPHIDDEAERNSSQPDGGAETLSAKVGRGRIQALIVLS